MAGAGAQWLAGKKSIPVAGVNPERVRMTLTGCGPQGQGDRHPDPQPLTARLGKRRTLSYWRRELSRGGHAPTRSQARTPPRLWRRSGHARSRTRDGDSPPETPRWPAAGGPRCAPRLVSARGRDHQLARATVVLHVVVGGGDLIQGVGLGDRHSRLAGGDRVQELLQDGLRQVGRLAEIAAEAHAVGQEAARVEVRHDPLVGQVARGADDAVDARGLQAVAQRRGANEIERGVHAGSRCGTVYGHTGNFPGFVQWAAATADRRRSVTTTLNIPAPEGALLDASGECRPRPS